MAAVRILIADDHEIVRRGLRLLIASRPDWQVCGEAEDGEEAIQKAKLLQPDVILLDVSMPRMNGLDAARILRREVPQSEIVIVSQNDPSIMQARALEVGARGYVAKSNLSRDLLPSVEKILGERSPTNGLGEAEQVAQADTSRSFLQGGGELGALMRSKDWSQTKLGPPENWAQPLKTCISICLKSRADLLIWWGPDLVILYNDAYSNTLGVKHPFALGKPGQEVWSEIWDVIGPMLNRVMATGEATWSDDLPLILERHGYPEETYHTFSYTPVPDEHGKIMGVFTPVTETTERVISERRLRTLRDLGARSADAKSEPEAWSIAAEVLSANPYDIPFALLYCINQEGRSAQAMGWAGIDPAHGFCAAEVSLQDTNTVLGTLLAESVKSGKPAEFASADQLPYALPGGVWGVPPRELIAIPLSQTGQAHPLGVLVAGVNRRKLLDDSYRTFFNLAGGQIAKSVADAQAYEQERRRAEALAELDLAKTAFFSNVSHEFRTPLTLMLGPLEDILEKPEDLPGAVHEQLSVVHRNSLRLLKLVNSLLDFSRIEAGRVQAVFVQTDLAKVTGEVASVFRSAMEKAGLEFEVECEALAEKFYVDRDMWEKIVLNLLSNAFKYTLEGSVHVSLREVNGSAELMVQDSGTGIPEHELPRLFERFHRVEGVHGRTHEGTGIGLALVQELVKLHGGSVRVESEFGEGSRFYVTIPAGKSHLPADRIEGGRELVSTGLRADSYVEEALRWLPAGSGAEEVMAAPSLGNSIVSEINPMEEGKPRELILLADDNADMRDYVRRLLSERYRVHAVANGRDAVDAAYELNPDLILTDVMMPGLDGFGVLRAIREHAETKAKPVILLSARAGEESRVEGLQAGADDYLVKPFTARELMARVGAHLNMARVRQETGELEKSLRSELESRVKERTAELERAEAGLRALSGRLLRAQDEERRRIARELHDSAGQMLAALSMTLQPLQKKLEKKDSAESATVGECVMMVNELTQELRTLSHLLHPPLLDEAGLPSALRWYVEGFAERSKIPVSIEMDSDLQRLPAEMETTIFRIIQESLTNIHRHSNSPTANIRINSDSKFVSLEIQDQGQGMPASMDRDSSGPVRAGVGIQGMRERVRQLGGTFRIDTGADGTLVMATLPLAGRDGDGRKGAESS
jgi:signal transduction histidine kinase/PAS domain-containing protein